MPRAPRRGRRGQKDRGPGAGGVPTPGGDGLSVQRPLPFQSHIPANSGHERRARGNFLKWNEMGLKGNDKDGWGWGGEAAVPAAPELPEFTKRPPGGQ